MDCRPPGSSVIGIPQARILKWLAISSSRVSSPPRDGTWVFSIAGEGHNGHNVCDIRDLANAGWPIFLFCPEPRRTLECYTSSPKMGEVPGKPNKLVTVPNISILLRIKEWMELMKAQTGPLPKAGAMYLESQRHILEKFGGVWECKKKPQSPKY